MEKLQATLADEILNNPCDLKKGLEMVTLLEAQLKEMNPNLDSVAEYVFPLLYYNADLIMYMQSSFNCLNLIGIGERSHYTMIELRILTGSHNSVMT